MTENKETVRLLSKHPSLRHLRDRGSWKIRPAGDLTAMIEESERRRNDGDHVSKRSLE